MLPDRVSLLLTAYVDGELTPRQQKAVLRLLRDSAAARDSLRQLQHDAERLRGLPRLAPGEDLAPLVLQAIAARKLRPARRPALNLPRTIPVWAGLAAAAAVLLVIGTGSYLYFAASHELAKPGDLQVVVSDLGANPGLPDQEELPAPRLAGAPTVDAGLPATTSTPADMPTTEKTTEPAAVVAARESPSLRKEGTEVGSAGAAAKPANDTTEDKNVLTIPNPKLEVFRVVEDPRLALILPVRDLDQEKPRQRLQEELQKDTSYRLELTCLESTKAFERLQAAFRAQGVRLAIDQNAQDRLKLGLPTNYILYTENVTPEELAKVIQLVVSEDKKAEAKRRGQGQFDRLVLNRMTDEDHRELAKLLGVDPTQLPAPKPRGPLGVDLRKPLGVDTAEKVEQSLKGQGAPRPDSDKPPGGTDLKSVLHVPERLALVLAYNPVRPRPASKEVQHFLDNRDGARPGTLRLLLVLRGSK